MQIIGCFIEKLLNNRLFKCFAKMQELSISSKERNEIIDITPKIEELIDIEEGICVVYCPHTTAAVTINENADPDVVEDIIKETEKIVPFQDGYLHAEGNSAAHIKSTLFGPSITIVVSGGRLVLGTWQSIFFCEFDGPRKRRVVVKVVGG